MRRGFGLRLRAFAVMRGAELFAVLVLSVATYGCASGAPQADGPTDLAPLDPTPTSTADDESGAVLAAYQGFWDAILAANDPPDEQHPALRETATGEAFASVFEGAQTNRLARRALRLPPDSVTEHRAEVVAIEGDAATVRDCAIDDGLVVDMDTGDVVNDEVETVLGTAELIREHGQWKVASTHVEQSWEGVAGCAVE